MNHDEWLKDYAKGEKPVKFGTGGTERKFELVPAGNHVAICVQVVDLGLQPGSRYYPDPKHQVRLAFELPTELVEYEKDGEKLTGPMMIGQNFTASMHEKANLRKFIESWFGKKFPSDEAATNFDFAVLVGHKCLLNVVHNESGGKTYANINTATPVPAGMESDYSQHNPSIVFSLEDPNKETFEKLPNWLKDKITNRLDAPAPDTGESPPVEAYKDEPYDDAIPF